MNTTELKRLKEESKLTTKQISDLSGIPESTISRILSGQTDNPTFDTVYAIVKAMGGSLDQLTDIPTETETEAPSSLIALYEKVITDKDRYIRILIVICCVLVSVLIFLVLSDVLNGSTGFVRY
ncbi:MAG: helix-turn-helix domain-containing protein [Acutalibacteraceae bacterium]